MIVLSEVYGGAVTFASTGSAAANQPASNLGISDLSRTYQDSSSATLQGVTWGNFGGTAAEVPAWAFVMAGINDAGATPGRNFEILADDVSPYSGASVILGTGQTDTYSPVTRWGVQGTPDMDRVDIFLALGIDVVNTGPTVDGQPYSLAHKSGLFRWVHAGGAHQDGYHRAAGFFIGISPLTLPHPHSIRAKEVELRKGSGWEVTLGWNFLPARSYTQGSVTYAGMTSLSNLATRQRGRPIIALLDTSGLTGAAVPNSSEAAPWGRLGVARIVELQGADFTTQADYAVSSQNYSPTLVLRTWEQEGHKER